MPISIPETIIPCLRKPRFVREQRFVYCRFCGRTVLQDRYNYEKHLEECPAPADPLTKDAEGNIVPLRSGSRAYALQIDGDVMNVYGFALIASFRETDSLPWQKGIAYRMTDCSWEAVYQCSIDRHGLTSGTSPMHYRAWITDILRNRIPCLNLANPDTIFRRFFSLPSARSGGDLLSLFFGITHRISRITGLRISSREKVTADAIPEKIWKALSGYSDACYVARETCRGENVLALYYTAPLKEGLPVSKILIAKDWLLVNTFTDLFTLAACRKDTSVSPLLVEADAVDWFAEEYPELLLDRYQGEYPLLPVMAPYLHRSLELLCKSGLGHLADKLFSGVFSGRERADAFSMDGCTRVQEMFRLPLGVLRKLNSAGRTGIPLSDEITALKALYGISPSLTAMPAYTPAYLKVITGNLYYVEQDWATPQPLRQAAACRPGLPDSFGLFPGVQKRLSLRQARQVLSYLVTQDLRYPERNNHYLFENYWRDSLALGEFPEGMTPRDLRKAEELAGRMVSERTDLLKEVRFRNALKNPIYQALNSQHAKSGDELALLAQPFRVLLPNRRLDLDEEGRNNHNCVATYIDAVSEGRSFILFLRRTDSLGQTLVTLEVSPRLHLIQAKGFANTKPNSEEQLFIRRWARAKGVCIDTCDISLPAGRAA